MPEDIQVPMKLVDRYAMTGAGRRNFIKDGLVLLASGVLVACVPQSGQDFVLETPISDSAPKFKPDLVYEGKTNEFTDESLEVVSQVFKNYGIKVISPNEWGGNKNQVWGLREIRTVATAISQLPPQYINNNERSPKELLLLRMPNTQEPGSGGYYARRQILLFTSANFNPDGEIYVQTSDVPQPITEIDHVKSTVYHEWTHSFTTAHEDLLLEFAADMGWLTEDHRWVTPNPDKLKHISNPDKNVAEDISFSVGLVGLNKSFIDSDRLKFFQKNSYYKDWQPLIEK